MKYLKLNDDDIYDLLEVLEDTSYYTLYERVRALKREPLTCEKHPKYKALRKPTSGCLRCWRIYHQQHIKRKLKASWKE